MKLSFIAFTTFTGLIASVAHAQSEPSQSIALQNEVLACRFMSSDNARLRCFDKALDTVFGVDEEIESQREASFGLPDQETSAVPKGITSTVSDVRIDRKYGTTVIALDNGQVWQTTSNGNLRRGFTVGATVNVEPGSFGSYRLTIDGRRGFRGVKRLR